MGNKTVFGNADDVSEEQVFIENNSIAREAAWQVQNGERRGRNISRLLCAVATVILFVVVALLGTWLLVDVREPFYFLIAMVVGSGLYLVANGINDAIDSSVMNRVRRKVHESTEILERIQNNT